MGTKFCVVCVSIKKNETKSNGCHNGAIMSTKFADDAIIDSFIDISTFFCTFTFYWVLHNVFTISDIPALSNYYCYLSIPLFYGV